MTLATLDACFSRMRAAADVLSHIAQDDLPFGGIGASGMGRYHDRDGFITCFNAKAVFHQSRWAPAAWLRPPYAGRVDRLVRYLTSASR